MDFKKNEHAECTVAGSAFFFTVAFIYLCKLLLATTALEFEFFIP